MSSGGLLDGAGSLGLLGAGLRTEGSWFEPQGRQNTAGVLVAGRCQVPSEHCPSALELGTEPTNAHIGTFDELATHPEVNLPSPVSPPRDPERDKAVQKTSCDEVFWMEPC